MAETYSFGQLRVLHALGNGRPQTVPGLVKTSGIGQSGPVKHTLRWLRERGFVTGDEWWTRPDGTREQLWKLTDAGCKAVASHPDRNPRELFTRNKRRILEALSDGRPRNAETLTTELRLPRRASTMHAIYWFLRHGYVRTQAPDGVDPDGYPWVLTEKGRAAAANLDYGYDLLNP
ncbi:MarR family winged helix-turn-helix transcriptional regulator [Nocardia wallacei]|uniref:MarR family winged helix-turn-helix transcriptional regulator n=1 Tax=Nocardia wallacei TaxID=480035 RepID=UPI002455B033|nr:MarR family winged helix-turn-helix transcriptional regulator [Nocardia wallacei]